MTEGSFVNASSRYESSRARSGLAFSAASRLLPSGVSRQTLVYPPFPFFGQRGERQYLWDVDGNRYLDLVNNYTSLIHGHAHEPSVHAATQELLRGGALGAPTKLELEFTQLLVERYPAIEKLRFAVSGSEAILFAIRSARAYTGRPRVLKFEGGFHGNHDEVQLSVGAEPLVPGTFGYGVPNSEGLLNAPTLVAIFNDRQSVHAAFAAHSGEIAVVIVEPFLGNAGLLPAAPGFLNFLAEIAHNNGALLLVDEIQSMRLSYGGVQELHDVHPDLIALGKILGGGLPLAAFGGRQEIMSVLDGFDPPVPQTGTFNAFSASLASGMATMRAFNREAVERLNDAGESARNGIRSVFSDCRVPVTVTGQGSMFNITVGAENVMDYQSWRGISPDYWLTLRLRLLNKFNYITARGTGCLSTPMTESDIDKFLADLHESVLLTSQAVDPVS